MREAEEAGPPADPPLMTMRVSRDSGQSWEPERAILATDDLAALITTEWPPCRCQGCMRRNGISTF
jgi:hypothetical protein